MPSRRPAFPLVLAGTLLVLTAACTGNDLEGKYYNTQTGEYAMELKGGKVLLPEGSPAADLEYEVRGDSVFLRQPNDPPGESLLLMRQADGILDAGPLGSLQKR